MNIVDHYNTPIIVGSKVAFNFQGQVRKGNVVAIKAAEKYGMRVNQWTKEVYCKIHVSHADKPGQISVVSSRFNVTVID